MRLKGWDPSFSRLWSGVGLWSPDSEPIHSAAEPWGSSLHLAPFAFKQACQTDIGQTPQHFWNTFQRQRQELNLGRVAELVELRLNQKEQELPFSEATIF